MEEIRRKEIAINIREHRKKRNITQKELAKNIGKNVRQIQQWEYGEFLPNLESVIAIAEYYGITIDELIN